MAILVVEFSRKGYKIHLSNPSLENFTTGIAILGVPEHPWN
jgi:hypothetical protein